MSTVGNYPSWQSQQRQSGAFTGQTNLNSEGTNISSLQQQMQQSWRPSGAQYEATSPNESQSKLQLPFPGSQPPDRPSSNSATTPGGGMIKSTTMSNDLSNTDGDTVPQTPLSPSGQPHRRTQSLRPLSAYQPLEHPDNGYQSGLGRQNSQHRPSSPTGSTTRSIRTAAAPLTFKSPELRSALGLQDAQNKKIYMEGYLSRRDHLNADGKPLSINDPKKRWHLCFVQLSGTVLSVWSVQQMEEAARQGTEVPPSYINVTDCFVDFIGTITETPQEVPGTRGRYENVFAINTAGQNRILFGVEGAVGRRLVQAWINGIRLASWEKIRLEEIYTGSLVRARLGAVSAQQATSGPGGAPGNVEMTIKSPLSKGGRMEGWVKARFMGSTEWKKCWLVLTDKGAEGEAVTTDANADRVSVTSQRSSFWKKLRSGDRSSLLIGSSSIPSLADTGLSRVEVPPGSNGAPGLACFYEGKKVKKPFATLAYASHAFAVYPSRPELVEGSSLFKVEGSFPLSTVISATNRNRQTGWVMIMPELDGPSSKGANAEMMKWCIAFMDAFHLYGRPSAFQWDARNPVSPFFAYPIGPYKDRLFLDRELAEFLDIREERHLANRNNLHGIMSARMRGERTPILPPLPQPNVDSTRSLNGTPGSASSSAVGVNNKNNSNDAAMSTVSSSSIPPLDFNRKNDSSSPSADNAANNSTAARPPPNSSGDASLASRGGLQSIGERSREGSVMTTLGVPTSATEPTDKSIPEDQEGQKMSRQGSQYSDRQMTDSNGVNADINGGSQGGPDSDQSTNLAYLSPNAGQAAKLDRGHSPSSFRTADHTTSTVAGGTTTSTGAPEASTSPKSMPAQASIPVTSSGAANVPNSNTLGVSRTLKPSGRGAEDSEALAARKVSDTSGQYDEGALYYINSMADQLPQIPTKSPRRDSSALAATAPVTTTTSPPPLPPTSTAQTSEVSSNGRSAAAPSLAAPAVVMRPGSMQAEEIDQDALAAYSFLNQPPSPAPPQINLPAEPAGDKSVDSYEQPAVASTLPKLPQSYPSTFGGGMKKTQERKMAAQAQAQAREDALTKPGARMGGATKKLKPIGVGQRKHAWDDDEDTDEDDDEEEEEEDDDDENRQVAEGVAAAPMEGQKSQEQAPPQQMLGSQRQYSPAVTPPIHPLQAQQQQRSMSPQSAAVYPQQQRHSMFNQHLGNMHDVNNNSNRNSGLAFSSANSMYPEVMPPSRNTFVQLGQDELPGAMTTAFQPQGLLQAGALDKAERSAKTQEAYARAEGTHMVNVGSKPPPPQAGLLGAITAHERDRKKEGGIGATLTERERERVQAERRQREEDMMRMQMMQQQQQHQQMMAGGQGGAGGWGGMPFNPMMWQQMQMMSMMNPAMMMGGMYGAGPGAQGSGSQLGHGSAPQPGSASSHGPSPEAMAAQQHAQMVAAQAAQQAYMAALSQHAGGSMVGGENGGGGIPSSPSMAPAGMGMMPFNPFMSMYGMPPQMGGGYPGMMASSPGSEVPPNMQSQQPQQSSQRLPAGSPTGGIYGRGQERQSNSPLRR